VKILQKLIADCDVLVENYLPDTLKKYSLDYETASRINPRLIYASITGYGQTGPYRSRAGYDVMVEGYVLPSSSPRVEYTPTMHTEKWA
jgi:succinate--hydroxymethylglutarate CoA-transferase